MKLVLVLGASGMVGNMVYNHFAKEEEWIESYASRREVGENVPRSVQADSAPVAHLADVLDPFDYAVNCIGTIKPYIHDDNPEETHNAIEVNSLFMHRLAAAAERAKCHVINIATDCVFSGDAGKYKETDYHDAWDVYGKTKSLGEVHSPYMHHLRMSLIGPEQKGHKSLLDWFLSNPDGSTVNGYYHHEWNGITTLAFAKICAAVIKNDIPLPHLQHIVPKDAVNKRDLLRMIAKVYGRDIKVKTDATEWMDRTLDTGNRDLNEDLWIKAGYENGPPTIEEMIEEMKVYS